MRREWAVVLLMASHVALAACDGPSEVKGEAVVVTPSTLITQSNRLNDDVSDAERQSLIESLADVVEADPVAAADRFERDIGGGAAIVRYAQAMVDAGYADRLGRQVAVVLRDGDPDRSIAQALLVSEPRDGTTWFRKAEKAGFFAGGVAKALSGTEASSDTIAAFAQAMGASGPGRTSSVSLWLRACGSDEGCGLNRAAETAYQSAFDRAFR